MTVNYDQVATLLSVVESCAGHGGKLSAISADAQNKLFAINDELRQEAIEAERQRREEAANAEAEAVAVASEQEMAGRAPVKPSAYPSGSRTDTIADRRA